MLQRRRRKDNISPKSHPSLTFINNLLHSKSTYFYKWWGEKNSTLSSKWGASNRLAYSCLVPSICILALLVGLYSFVNPVISDSDEVYAWDWSSVEENSNTNDDSIKFSINSESSGSINAKVGETAYSNHTVSINLANAKGYALGISYTNDSTGLVNKDAVSTSGAENSVISGANNTTGTNMADNTWGYSWNSNINADSTTMVYKTVPSKNNIATLAESTNLANNKLDMTGKLAFAVKFGDKAVAGHYTTNVLLSLAVQPAEVVFDGITTMQQMTSTICSNAKENDEAILTDTRDNKKYYVTKLKDGTCWMTQNLAYNGGGTSRGTNCSGWTDTNTVAQYCSLGHTDGDHASRGNYYSWPAAMNGNTSATGTVQGICPNGWHLPTSNTTAKGSFGGLAAAYGAANDASGSTIMRGSPMYFQYNGYVVSSGNFEVGSNGFYWSSVPNGLSSAYRLHISSSVVDTYSNVDRYGGYSVRCLALDEETYTYTVIYKLKDGQVLYSGSKVPDTQTVTTTDGSYAFKVASGPCLSTGPGVGVCGGDWAGDDGQTYASNGQVTLTLDKPTIVMTYNGGGSYHVYD